MAKNTETVLDQIMAAERAHQNANTVVLSDGSTLANVMNGTAATGQKNAIVASAIAPRRVKCPPADGSKSCSNCMLYHGPASQKGTTMKTATNVKQGVVSPATDIEIPGVTLVFSNGAPDDALIRAMAAYKGKNPFYVLCEALAVEKRACHIKISAEKSQLAKVRSAMHSLKDRKFPGSEKLFADGTTEKTAKGELKSCYLIRRP